MSSDTKLKYQVLKLFMSWCWQLPIIEFVKLLELHVSELPLYILNEDRRSVRLASLTEIPWHVVFVLTQFHRKHVFPIARLPPLVEVTQALQQFASRMR